MVVPLSFKTNLFAKVPVPCTVILPATVVAPALIEPVVLMTVEPSITAAPSMVPPVMAGLVSDLLTKVSVASRVTMTPELGKVAVETIPVPPFAFGKRLVIAAG